MLRFVRILLSIVSILAVTLLFVDFTGIAREHWAWLAQIQLMPAILALNLAVVIVILVATLVLGRVYCSVVCPLGIFQDVVNWISGHVGSRKRRSRRLHYTPARSRVRLVVFTVFAALVVLSLCNVLFGAIAGLIEPYSAYGRIASQIFAPAYDAANNLMADVAQSAGSYLFYRVAIYVSIPVLIVAIVTLVVVVVMAWRGGRDYCNTICPVGTLLGAVSRYSILRPVIDTERCIGCGKCARACKSKCIDAKNHDIDMSRCVVCMDCIGNCSEGAIRYTYRRRSHSVAAASEPATEANTGRRTALALLGLVSFRLFAGSNNQGGRASLKPQQRPTRAVPVLPAGAVSIANNSDRCTACQLCVQSCPNHVLRPSLSLSRMMQPELDFADGYCDPECVACSTVCPTGAIRPIEPAEKSSIRVGIAKVDYDLCLSATEGVNCHACERHCPAGAITKVETPRYDNRSVPVVNTELCIGCGACEYHCPAGHLEAFQSNTPAIHVDGVEIQHII